MVNIFRKMADKWKELSEEARDRKEFQKLVSEKTKPIRRASYLKEKMKQAVDEGFMLAQQEKLKKEQRRSNLSDFGISEKQMKEIESRGELRVNKVSQINTDNLPMESLTKSQSNILNPTVDWGFNNPSKYIGGTKLNKNGDKK